MERRASSQYYAHSIGIVSMRSSKANEHENDIGIRASCARVTVWRTTDTSQERRFMSCLRRETETYIDLPRDRLDTEDVSCVRSTLVSTSLRSVTVVCMYDECDVASSEEAQISNQLLLAYV